MNLSHFFSILRARWSIALLMIGLTVGSAIAVTLLSTKQYTAAASLVVDQMRPDPVAMPSPWSGMPSPAYMATQVDVLRSERVASRVVRNLKLAESPKVKEEWMKATRGEGSIESWIGEGLQFRLDVKPSLQSNVIAVAFKASDPQFAATVANAFVQSYLDTSVELRVDPARQYSSFFDSRAKELRATLEAAQARLNAYQREKGIVVASDGQLDVENMRLNELSSQLTALQAVAAESSSRQAFAQGGGADGLQEVLNNPNLALLRGDITRAEARLQELNSRLGENHPQVVEAKANVSSLRSRLEGETRRVTSSVGVTNTINRQREAELRGALEAQRAKVMRMKTARDEGSVLVREVENAQKAYDAVLSRFSQASLESQATQSNVYVLNQATPPLLPSSPRVVMNISLSIVAGLILALGAVFLLELFDRRVRTVDGVAELLDLPVLGVLPRPGRKGQFAGRRMPLVLPRRMSARLPAPHRGS
jgi:succinoglycan biosynthesis transport protein ExoP